MLRFIAKFKLDIVSCAQKQTLSKLIAELLLLKIEYLSAWEWTFPIIIENLKDLPRCNTRKNCFKLLKLLKLLQGQK